MATEKIKKSKGCANKMVFNRYDLAVLWVKSIKRIWTSSFIADSFRRTGVQPFCRSAHLVGNSADIEIADTIAESDEMQRQAHQRLLRNQERSTTPAPTEAGAYTPMPIRLPVVTAVSQVCGGEDVSNISPAYKVIVDKHKLGDWPRSEAARTNPKAWQISLRKSPELVHQLRQVDVETLRKWFGVGAVLTDMDVLSTQQVYNTLAQLPL